MPPLILVVDDEPAICKVLSHLLSDEGFRVRTASDGQDALEQVAVEPPDLIITDVRMPRLDGLTMLRRLREQGFGSPVILVSAHHSGIGVSGVQFLEKPFDIDHLMSVVNGLISPQRS